MCMSLLCALVATEDGSVGGQHTVEVVTVSNEEEDQEYYTNQQYYTNKRGGW